MTSSIPYKFAQTSCFADPLTQAYTAGKVDLDSTSKVCLRMLKDIGTKNLMPQNERFQNLLHIKELCVLGIEAKTNYYRETIWGRIADFFQSKLSLLFGYKTPIQAAQEVREAIDQCIETSFYKPVIPSLEKSASDLKAYLFFARYLAMVEGQTVFIPTGNNPVNPDQIFIAKTDGDVYLLTRNEKDKFVAQGSGRTVYKGACYSTDKPPREIAIITSLPKKGLSLAYSEADLADIAKVSQKMKKEQQQLEPFKASDGIIKIHDHFKTTIGGIEIGLSIMDYYKQDLDSYLSLNSLNNPQKLDLMRSLWASIKEIHEKKKVHRDIKEKNILIDYDPIKQKVKPVLIDFESCMDIADEERKKEISSTMQYWAPEYLAAYQKGLENAKNWKMESSLIDKYVNFKIAPQTSPAMDIWSLGLTFYRIWYGKTLAETIDPSFNARPEKDQNKTLNEIYNSKNGIEKAFPRERDPIDTMIRSMLSIKPEERPISISFY